MLAGKGLGRSSSRGLAKSAVDVARQRRRRSLSSTPEAKKNLHPDKS